MLRAGIVGRSSEYAVGMVKVTDPRVDKLSALYKPKRPVPSVKPYTAGAMLTMLQSLLHEQGVSSPDAA